MRVWGRCPQRVQGRALAFLADCPAPMKLRFAPSPTGLLHVGNARPALANWLFARRHGGQFLLRLDDTDRERSRPEYEAAIEQDLHWLGLDWDESFRQSDRLALYAEAADRLRASGRLYPCFESEEELRFKREQRLRQRRPPVYDRAMLQLTETQRADAEAGGKRPYWRFRLSDASVTWNDLVLGERTVKLPAISDPVLIRADGTPLYAFTSVVDDLECGITHVIRGEDHVTNTGVQLDLWTALGGEARRIRFGHMPLLLDGEGAKLSKRLDSLSLRGLRQDGVQPEAVTTLLARLGTGDGPEPMPLEALARRFDPARVSHAPSRFDMQQLLALNARLLHALPFEQARDRLPEGADARFWEVVRTNLELLSEARLWWQVVHGEIDPPPPEDGTDQAAEAAFLREAAACLPPGPWDEATWPAWTAALRQQSGRKGRALFHPLRLALTGEEEGPEMRLLLPLIGRARALRRLK